SPRRPDDRKDNMPTDAGGPRWPTSSIDASFCGHFADEPWRACSWPRTCRSTGRTAMRILMTSRTSILALALVPLAASFGATLRGSTQSAYLDLVDARGHIRKPPAYRDRYQVLGAYVVLDPTSMVTDAPKPNGDEMHYTYASPGTAEFYRKNGRF